MAGFLDKLKSKSEAGDAGKKPPLALLGALALVILSVGFWQYQNMGGDPPVDKAEKSAEDASKKPDANDGANLMNATMLAQLPQQDPFKPDRRFSLKPVQPENNEPVATNRSNGGYRIDQPLPPLTGSFGLREADPNNVEEPPSKPILSATIEGVVQGPKSLAIVRNADGTTRFARPGDSLGNGYRLVEVKRGSVMISGHGERFELRPGQEHEGSEEYSQGGRKQ